MRCVYYGDDLPNGFEEKIPFSPEKPYTISIKRFQVEDVVPLHYAETLEILLCDELCGEILIDATRFQLEEKQLVVIPPYTVHSTNVQPGGGTMYVVKVSLRELRRYIDVENYLAACGCGISQLQYRCGAYTAVYAIVEKLIERDGELGDCLPLLLELFRVLSKYVDTQRETASLHGQFRGSSLQELIHWTNQNYARKISIDEVAQRTGYSKYHFCSRFKSLTGITYMNYLNSVRVSHACLMLQNGESVQAVGRSVGFENSSYFTQPYAALLSYDRNLLKRRGLVPASAPRPLQNSPVDTFQGTPTGVPLDYQKSNPVGADAHISPFQMFRIRRKRSKATPHNCICGSQRIFCGISSILL